MNNDPKKELLHSLEETILPYTNELGAIAIVFDRDQKPGIVYSKNVTDVFAIAILQEVTKRMIIDARLNEKT